jgi:hypothetical protein
MAGSDPQPGWIPVLAAMTIQYPDVERRQYAHDLWCGLSTPVGVVVIRSARRR